MSFGMRGGDITEGGPRSLARGGGRPFLMTNGPTFCANRMDGCTELECSLQSHCCFGMACV